MNLSTPAGFRDVLAEEAVVREKTTRAVQDLFAERGYLPIETPTLEVMDVVAAGNHMPASPFKFFDSQGDLLAMRPDVTLQVARMYATRLAAETASIRLRYTQRVFRETEAEMQAAARELTQMGVECIGEEGSKADAELIALFADALKVTGVERFTLALATVGVLRALLDRSGAPEAWKQAVLDAYHRSNFVDLDRLTSAEVLTEDANRSTAPAYAQAIRELPRIRGGREAIERARELVAPLGCIDGLDDFEETFTRLAAQGLGEHLLVDFSVMRSFDYYTGIVFVAYAPRLGTPLGSGGRYDHLLEAFGAHRSAAGFAFYLEQVMEASALPADIGERPLRIAVPKGALNGDTIRCLTAAGLDTTGLDDPGRALIIHNPGVDYIIVRPTDAPVFVALGAADCGICGKDSLLEAAADVVELVDLQFGGCRFVVAEPAGAAEEIREHYKTLGSIRVATKYPHITRAHYAKTGTQVEIVKLHGNIELAPLTGMAERIVDITATGTTLRENNLVVVEEVLPSTARFLANTCALRTDGRIVALARTLAGNIVGDQNEA